ncbi:dUTP diphosphatase [Roseospirillum parvum]|uniref:Deoxyuridine 5'-triphosphate nucleotidohydrolase n=1 Tax=Roseospirillum parvum TaxID=83401 RepID=A0A1G8FYL9_9PROT|nr:dUTP diphosphatase [Roseospirillum parvum]SDH87223.1 dUTP pyrophosphatase [Roseospirillum parvum]
MDPVAVPVIRLPHADTLPLPTPATAHAAGVDLMAAIGGPQTLAAGAFEAIPTGLAIALPEGYEAQVRPRSGLAARHGVTVLNSPGTIDADYRGEIKVILINHGHASVTIEPGQRIAQLVVAPVARLSWQPVDSLPETARGAGGLGSTGV